MLSYLLRATQKSAGEMRRGLLTKLALVAASVVTLSTVLLLPYSNHASSTTGEPPGKTGLAKSGEFLRHVVRGEETAPRSSLLLAHKLSPSKPSNDEQAASFIAPLPKYAADIISSHSATTAVTPSTAHPVTQAVDLEHPSVRTRGYLLAAAYDQQLHGGFHGYSQLAEITAMFNLTAVEPYVVGTKLFGAPPVISEPLKLRDLYDLEHVKAGLKSHHGLEEFASFSSFAERASRRTVVVFFLTDLRLFKIYFSGRNRRSNIVEIDPNSFNVYIRDLMKTVNMWTSTQIVGRSIPFIVSRIVFINAEAHKPLPLSYLMERLGSILDEEVKLYGTVTVIIERWRGIHNKNDSKFFYYIPGFVTQKPLRTLPYSEAVLTAAAQFAQKINSPRPIIGVHIRGERLLRDFKGNVSRCVQCLAELKSFLSRRPAKVAKEQVHVFHDLGYFGTQGCTDPICLEGRLPFLAEVDKLDFPVLAFYPAEFDSVPKSSAFVSLVELEYLSHADMLVTVGRGGFQKSLEERFLEHSGGSNGVHKICNIEL